jgi:Protein RETICULATA-related
VDQQELRTGVKADKELAPVLENSIGWGSFVGVSSNSRYQIVGAIEERLLVSSKPLQTLEHEN